MPVVLGAIIEYFQLGKIEPKPQLEIRCLLRLARFLGLDKMEFIDNKQVYGNIFTLIRAALRFANEYLPIASTFPKGTLQNYIINTGGVLLTMPSKQSLGPRYQMTNQHDPLFVMKDQKILTMARPIGGLPPRQKHLLIFLTKNGPLNSQQLHEQLEIKASRRTLRRDLLVLLNLGLVKKTGQSKIIVWHSLVSVEQFEA